MLPILEGQVLAGHFWERGRVRPCRRLLQSPALLSRAQLSSDLPGARVLLLLKVVGT